MRYALAFLPVVATAAILEIAAASFFAGDGPLGSARPDLELVVLCVVAFNLPERSAVLAGLVAGVTLDIFSGGAFGICAAVYAAAGFGASRIRHGVAHDTVLFQFLAVFFLAGFVEAASIFRLGILSSSFDVYFALKTSVFSAFLSALAAPVVFQIRPVFERISVLPPGRSIAGNDIRT